MTENRPRCIVCNKPIAKRTSNIWFRKSRAAIDLGPIGGAQIAKPNGTRSGSEWNIELWLDELPRSKDEAARHGNGELQRVRYGSDGTVQDASFWDGESYQRKYFCTDKCAVAQGLASAHHGERFTWRKG